MEMKNRSALYQRRTSQVHHMCVIAIALLCSFALSISAQQPVPRIQGALDTDVPTPVLTGHVIGFRDPQALAELLAYTKASVGTAWTGMNATGMITLTGSTEAVPAKLSMLAGNRSRLEISGSKEAHLTIVGGGEGRTQYDGSKTKRMSPSTAAAGIAPFDVPGAAAIFPERYSIVDQGVVAIEGIATHRITIESKLAASGVLPNQPSCTAMDFYFDPQTHLLRKSSALVNFPGDERQQVLRVTTYGSYQAVGAVTLPFSFSESIDGQPTWSLQLTAADVVNLPNPELF